METIDSKQKKILIIDDERIYIDVLVDLLQPEYKVIVAKNGDQALKRACEEPAPDLILLDWLMPGMDGQEVCYKLRDEPATHDIPVIFLTVKSEVEDEVKGLELGAVDYIRKPLSPPIVLARVRTQLALRQAKNDLHRYNLELADKIKERTTQLVEKNETLSLLNNLSERLQETMEVKVIAQETVNAMVSISQPPLVAIYLLDDETQMLNLVAQHGYDDEMTDMASSLPVDGSLNGAVLKEKRLVMIRDLSQLEGIHSGIKNALLKRGISNAVVIPIISQGKSFGTIGLSYKQAEDIDRIDEETYLAIGRSVALALSNARYVSVLEYQALHDHLTGLPNRDYLHQECSRMLSKIVNDDSGLAMILFDIDRFKEINDTLGHNLGDSLLIQIAERVSSALANKDTLFCRLGGDEFALVFHIDRGSDEALSAAQGLLQALTLPFEISEMSVGISASMGLSTYPEHANDCSGLLRCADVAMYQAKCTGASVDTYDTTLDQHSPERLAMIVELGNAIRENQLMLQYQPKVDLKNHGVTGFEALIRWNHPRLGRVEPGAFIPLAEVSDQIHHLLYWVVDLSLSQLKKWSDSGMNITIAINLSTRNLLDQDCPAHLESLIQKHGIDPHQIELEITESALMYDTERTQQTLNQIADLGVVLSIDDYGTGYSSLAYLKRLPVSTLKIDSSFVMDMMENQHDHVIVRSTINLAHSLGLKVIAEGVEDKKTMGELTKLGCDYAQGYHISRPMDDSAIDQWLKQY